MKRNSEAVILVKIIKESLIYEYYDNEKWEWNDTDK